MYALAATIVIGGALIGGASLKARPGSPSSLPAPIMLFMMRGMHGRRPHGGHDQHHDDRDEDPLHRHTRR